MKSADVFYEYDVLDRRTSRIEGTTTNYFIYDGDQVAADLDGSENLLRTYSGERASTQPALLHRPHHQQHIQRVFH